MTERYEIETVLDFLKVPADRLDICLCEFRFFLEIARNLQTAFNNIQGSNLGKPFVWLDDGKRKITVNLEVKVK